MSILKNVSDFDFPRKIKEKITNFFNKMETEERYQVFDEKLFNVIIVEQGKKQDVLDFLNAQLVEADLKDIDASEIFNWLRIALNGKTVAYDNKELTIGCRKGGSGGFYTVDQANESLGPEIPKNLEKIQEEFEEEEAKIEEKGRDLEKSYYEPVRIFAVNNGFEDCKITGGRIPRPKWENPDLVQISYNVGRYLNTIEFEIASFEVKLKVEPFAVWQAANYKKFSTWVYVAFAKSAKEIKEKDGGAIFSIAVDLGIGVLAFNSSTGQFEEIHSSSRNLPRPSEVDSFIGDFYSEFKVQVDESKKELQTTLEIPLLVTRAAR